MRISRRVFACGLAGIAATAAGRTQVVSERRVYGRGSALPPTEILHRNGIRPASIETMQGATAYLFMFESLEARLKAWDRFNGDEAWCAVRDAGNVAIKEIRVYPGGKIFEISL
jgi:hypothetical protein